MEDLEEKKSIYIADKKKIVRVLLIEAMDIAVIMMSFLIGFLLRFDFQFSSFLMHQRR